MPTKKEPLYSSCCQEPLDEETGTCHKCRQWVEEPLKESELYDNEEFILL